MIYMDSEFNRVNHPQVNPVCATTHLVLPGKEPETLDWWVHNSPKEQKKLAEYLMDNRTVPINAYAAVAEARFLLSIGVSPLDFKWVDQFVEYRQLTNNHDKLAYGKQLVNGRVKMTKRPPPKWERTEQDDKSAFKPTHSLLEATFKLTGVIRDSEHKQKMRDLIISDPKEFLREDRIAISKYCNEDTIYLPTLWKRMKEEYRELLGRDNGTLLKEVMLRGDYSAVTGMMEAWGYPIDYEKTRNFSDSVLPLIEECQREINSLFPDIKPFVYDRKERKFSMNQGRIKDWLKANVDTNAWKKTDGFVTAKKAEREAKFKGLEVEKVDPADYLSLSLEAFEKKFDFRHTYPKDNFGAQMVRYLKLKQNLNGFVPNKNGSFWDAVGPDNRVRAYLNPFGAQSSRNQPGARSFLFLKPAWMRALCSPKFGRAMASFDYGSEEYLISALLSKCQPMIDSYASGDVYLAFAKLARVAPENATKESHKFERDLCKAIVLAMSYQMTAKGLAAKLTVDTGKLYTEEQAQGYIDMFYRVFSDLADWQNETLNKYQREGMLELPCKWRMFGDNDNFRSICNVPSQGCLHGECRVLTEKWGYQKISFLTGNNRIRVWDGEQFVVADCVPSGVKEEVLLELSNGQEIKCSPIHKFLVSDNRGKTKWVEVLNLKKNDRIVFSKPTKEFGEEIIWPDKPVLNTKYKTTEVFLQSYTGTPYELGLCLGRLLSDGSINKKVGACWVFAEHEEDVMQKMIPLIQKFGVPLKTRTLKRENRIQKINFVYFYSASFCDQIDLSGLQDNLESPFLWSNSELMRGFLCGYADGDGGVTGKGDRAGIKITFGRNRKEYAKGIQLAFTSLGIKTRKYERDTRIDVSISSESRDYFVRNIGFIKEEKQKRAEAIPSPVRTSNTKIPTNLKVKKVTKTGNFIEMFDIANCPEQRFCTNGVVTHNTGASILRKAIITSVKDYGLQVAAPLHDAAYIEYDSFDLEKIDLLHKAMFDAFIYYFDDKKSASLIRLDGFTWSYDYPAPKIYTDERGKKKKDYTVLTTPKGLEIDCADLYIDERAEAEYEQFSKYFAHREEMDL